MSDVVGEAVVRIRQDDSGFDPADAGKRAGTGYSKGFGGAIKGLGAAIAGVVVAGKALDFLGDSVGEAREAQKVAAATTQIIKSTGSAANVTADEVSSLAGALSAKAGVDDELIQTGANLLLTFKGVRNEVGKGNDVFNQATAAALDLSAAGFGSVESASVMLGKALNDPTKGISALGRAGVTFTESQKEQVKALQASGDLLGAQKIILKEVEGQVGGVAEATATAGEKASVAFGNIKESIGTALLPAIDAASNFFVGVMAPAIEEVVARADDLGPVVKVIGNTIAGVFGGGGGAGGAVEGFRSVFESLSTTVGAVIPVISSYVTGDLLPAVTALGGYLSENLLPVFVGVADVITTQVLPILGQIAQFIYGQVLPAVVAIVTEVSVRLKPVFDQLVATFQTQVLPMLQKVGDQIRNQLIPAIKPLILFIIQWVGTLLKIGATILGFVLPPIIRFSVFIASKVIPVVVSIITWVAKFIGGLINLGRTIGTAIGRFAAFASALTSGVGKAVSGVVTAIANLPGKVLGFVGRMVTAGKSLIGGLFRGITSAAGAAGGFVGDLASKIVTAVKGAINDALNLPLTISINKGPININATVIPRLQSGSMEGVAGGVYDVGEVGPERVYLPTGARVLTAAQTRQAGNGIDYDALAVALASVLGPLLAGQRPVQFMLPTGDPEAAAMAAMNRLATVA